MAERKFMTLDRMTQYHEKEVARVAAEDAKVLSEAKSYADGLADNYDSAGSAATAKSEAVAEAKSYADGLAGNYDAAGSASAVQGKLDEEIARAKGAEAGVQAEVDALETYVGTIPSGATATDIVGYVQEKTAGIATDAALNELQEAVNVIDGDVATIKGDYLKASDKNELKGDIATEKSRAEGVEAGLQDAIDAIEADYLKAADKTALQEQITTNANAIELLTNGVKADEVDGVNDLIQYVKEHGTEVTGMKADIAANTKAVADEATRAKGVESGLDTRIASLETAVGSTGSVSTAIATAKQEAIDVAKADATSKANQALADAKADTAAKVEAVQGEVDAVETRVGTAEEDIDAIQTAIAEGGSVAVAIANAQKAADDAQGEVDALETVVAGKASASDLTALDGRVTTAEGKITTLEGKMTAVEKKAADNATAIAGNAEAIATKASQTDLTNAVKRIAANETAIAEFVEITEAEINALFN